MNHLKNRVLNCLNCGKELQQGKEIAEYYCSEDCLYRHMTRFPFFCTECGGALEWCWHKNNSADLFANGYQFTEEQRRRTYYCFNCNKFWEWKQFIPNEKK